MRKPLAVPTVLILAATAIPAAAATANPESLPGAKVYQAKCAACHSLDANKIGPAHRGVYGRSAGSAPGYGYSPGMKPSGIVWTDKTLDLWLQGPQKLVKGARMYFTLQDPAERTAVIAYLKATSGK
ncbi:MAG TPA: c-type cytochrome [Novosphingobium sp.]